MVATKIIALAESGELGRSAESSLPNFTAGFLNSLLTLKACSGATWKDSISS
jgi:hypothetical protein